MMNGDVLAGLLAGARDAEAIAQGCRALAAQGALDDAGLARALCGYIAQRYRLAGEGPQEGYPAVLPDDDLEELGRRSVAATASLGQAADDTAANCDGADSAAVKHAFLMMAIQRDFAVEVPPMEAAFAETVRDLAALVGRGLGTDPAPAGDAQSAPAVGLPAPSDSQAGAPWEREDAFLQAMELLADPLLQHQYVLSFANDLDPLPAEDRIDDARMGGCTARAWAVAAYDASGRMHVRGYSDALIVRGFMGVLAQVVEGADRSQIERWEPRLMGETRIGRQLMAQRRKGLGSLIGLIRHA